MGWKERVRQGSFRGVDFLLEDSESEFSRRVIVHEFPQRETSFIEDLGKNARSFSINGYFLGDDYLEQRDIFLLVCEEEGSGPLVHPYFGEIQARCTKVRFRDSRDEARMVRFSADFVEEGLFLPVEGVVNTAEAVHTSAREALEQNKSLLERVYDYASLPYAAAASVLEIVNGAVDAVEAAQKPLLAVDDFARTLRDVGGSTEALVLSATELANRFHDLITFGFLDEGQDEDSVPDLRQSFHGLETLLAFAPATDAPSSSSDAFSLLLSTAALIQSMDLLARIEFESVDEAHAFRESCFDAVDALQDSGVDDALKNAVLQLRFLVQEDLDLRSASLPRETETRLQESLPSLVLSFMLYGDVTQADDIVQRNGVQHPGFLPTSRSLKVLSDVG